MECWAVGYVSHKIGRAEGQAGTGWIQEGGSLTPPASGAERQPSVSFWSKAVFPWRMGTDPKVSSPSPGSPSRLLRWELWELC